MDGKMIVGEVERFPTWRNHVHRLVVEPPCILCNQRNIINERVKAPIYNFIRMCKGRIGHKA